MYRARHELFIDTAEADSVLASGQKWGEYSVEWIAASIAGQQTAAIIDKT